MPDRRWMRVAKLSLLGLVLVTAPLLYLLWPLAPSASPWQDEASRADYRDLLRYAGRSSEQEVRAALKTVDPRGQLRPFLSLHGDRALIFAAAREAKPTVVLPLAPRAAPRSRPAGSGLAGKRILLDPGHFGGAWSQIENRHKELEPGRPVREGDLTYATARLLEARLKAAGAVVRLTRGAPPQSAFEAAALPAFDAGREAAFALADELAIFPASLWHGLYPSRIAVSALEGRRRQLEREHPFQLFNRRDLRRHAELGRSWDADLLLSIHYNTMGPRPRNGVLVFVPGNFLAGELNTRASRRDAIRRAVDATLADATALARVLSRNMQHRMALGPLPLELKREGSIMRALAPDQGVYARNLAVLRRSSGLALLVEGPCVDEPAEYRRLLSPDLEVEGKTYPQRVKQFSDGLYDGLVEGAALIGAAR